MQQELTWFEMFIRTYGGWAGLAIYFLWKDVLPLITHRWMPARIKAAETQADFVRDIEERRLKMAEDAAQAEQVRAERDLACREVTAKALEQQTLLMQALNAKFDAHDGFVRDSVSDMKQHVAATTGQTVPHRPKDKQQ